MGEIVIRFDRFILERMVYIIIILVLAILLVFSYLSDSPSENVVQEENTEQNNQLAEQENEEVIPEANPEPEESIVDATCSDGIENQDETAVDCGGVCTTINGEYFYDNECHDNPEPQEPTLSGEIEFEVSNVKTSTNENSGAIRVTSFDVEITNGEGRSFFPEVIAIARSGSVDLNQIDGSYDEEDGDTPYMGPFPLDKVESGETLKETLGGGNDEGSYPWTTVGSYDPGDDFTLVIELYDDNGDKIDQVTRTVRG